MQAVVSAIRLSVHPLQYCEIGLYCFSFRCGSYTGSRKITFVFHILVWILNTIASLTVTVSNSASDLIQDWEKSLSCFIFRCGPSTRSRLSPFLFHISRSHLNSFAQRLIPVSIFVFAPIQHSRKSLRCFKFSSLSSTLTRKRA